MLGAKGSKIVTVVGAAHVAGILRSIDRDIDRAALVTVPPRRKSRWALAPLAVAALAIAFAVSRGAPLSAIMESLSRLALSTAVGSAAFVLVVGGGLISALASGVLAPVSLFLPAVHLGRAVGAVQGRIRPPSPDDAGAVRVDMLSPPRLRKNSFLVVLLVFAASRLGRTIGAVVGFIWVAVRLLRAH